MNREYKENLSRQIEKNYSDLEMRIMEDIVRRIKKAGEITSTADWQINRLRILGNSSEDIEKMIKEALDASYPEMFELYDQVIDWEYVRNKDVYEQINAEFIPYEENKQLQQITDALIQQTDADLQNITQSLGFYLNYGGGKPVLTPLAEVYQKYLDAACMDIVSGAFDYNTVIRRVVTQLTNSGLRQIDYASGRANRVDVAARRAVMTGITQLTGHISDFNAEKLGTEYYEVAWHAGARPTHQVWQGKVWSKEQLVTVCGLGTVTGLEGVNCYHERYPFIPGVSERNWSDDWLEEQNRKENTPKNIMKGTRSQNFAAAPCSLRRKRNSPSPTPNFRSTSPCKRVRRSSPSRRKNTRAMSNCSPMAFPNLSRTTISTSSRARARRSPSPCPRARARNRRKRRSASPASPGSSPNRASSPTSSSA